MLWFEEVASSPRELGLLGSSSLAERYMPLYHRVVRILALGNIHGNALELTVDNDVPFQRVLSSSARASLPRLIHCNVR